MKLVEFRVRNYRSINDSGPIAVADRRTALVGRNESGKSNLLNALKSLNPPDGARALSKIKDFPKDRRMSEFSEDLPVVDTRWELSAEDRAELTRRHPRAKDVAGIRVSRGYSTQRTLVLEGLSEYRVDADRAFKAVDGLADVKSRLGIERAGLAAELGKLVEAAHPRENVEEWAESVRAGVIAFRKKVGIHEMEPHAATLVDEVANTANGLLDERDRSADARGWLLQALPVFIYVPDYAELEGHVDLDALLERIESEKLRTSDENFLKMMKVAGLDVKELHRLLAKQHELRQHLVNRGGAVVTKALRRLWSDRALKVRFNVDANHFDVLVSDPNALYDVEVNLDERSRGFRWFFSFYVTFAADSDGGPAANAVLLLDEPGMHLHARGQQDLLEHFSRDFKNQILWTTHSPFMVPFDDPACVRSVDIHDENGTTVSADASAVLDPRTAERFDSLVAHLRKRVALA